jgi:hypothetical protein
MALEWNLHNFIYQTGVGRYCEQSQKLIRWAIKENNRIKRSKLIRIAEKMERLYRKGHRWDNNIRVCMDDLSNEIDYSGFEMPL